MDQNDPLGRGPPMPRRPQSGPVTSRRPGPGSRGLLEQRAAAGVPHSDAPDWNRETEQTRTHPLHASADAAQPRQQPPPSVSHPAVARSAIFGAHDGRPRHREVSWGAVLDDVSNLEHGAGYEPRVGFSGPLGSRSKFSTNLGDLHRRRPGDTAGPAGPASPNRPVPPRSGILTKSMIMCMDPTCNSCPAEMHAYRNLKLMQELQKDSDDEQDDQGEEAALAHNRQGSRTGGASGDAIPAVLQDMWDDIFKDDLEDDVDDPEGGKRMVIRFCGVPIISYSTEKSRVPDWLRWCRFWESFSMRVPVFNPHSPFMHKWSKYFVSAALVGFFLDPLFFFVLGILDNPPNYMCLTMNWTLAIILSVVRFLVDIWYMVHIFITFRTAYAVPAPSERSAWWWWSKKPKKDPSGLAPGEMVFNAKYIARNYLRNPNFFVDLICALPLPQIIVLIVVPAVSHTSQLAVSLVLLALLLQAIPRGFRLFLKFQAANARSGFLFESAWATFLLNMAYYFMVSHMVGSAWYLFSVERVSQCFSQACADLGAACDQTFLFCDRGTATTFYNNGLAVSASPWASSPEALACLQGNGTYDYGIFQSGVPLTYLGPFFPRYLTSLYWGFQQVSTMAGNQMPSPWVPEVLFILTVAVVGLLLLALLIGNMSNFLQALSRRSFEYQMNCRDVQLWLHRRNIPLRLQKKVKNLLRLQWATTKGVEDLEVLRLLTEDLQRDLRSKLCENLLTASPLFKAMKESIPKVLDAFCERLEQRIYIEGTEIVKEGYPVSRLFFILKGSVCRTSTRTGDLGRDEMNKGDFLGEELLIYYLDKLTRDRREDVGGRSLRSLASFNQASSRFGSVGATSFPRSRTSFRSGDSFEEALPTSGYTAVCVGPVEGYSLDAADVAAVCKQYSRELLDPRLLQVLNHCSRRRRVHYARTIQCAWRRYMQRKHKWSLREVVEAAQSQRLGAMLRAQREPTQTESPAVSE